MASNASQQSRPGTGSVTLTLDDATELNLDEIEEVASVIAKSFQIQFQKSTGMLETGISPAYNEVRDWNLVFAVTFQNKI